MKFSDNPDKSTNPGVKQLWRLYGDDGLALADLMTLEDERPGVGEEILLHHPSADWRRLRLRPAEARPLLSKVMAGGKICAPLPSLADIAPVSALGSSASTRPTSGSSIPMCTRSRSPPPSASSSSASLVSTCRTGSKGGSTIAPGHQDSRTIDRSAARSFLMAA